MTPVTFKDSRCHIRILECQLMSAKKSRCQFRFATVIFRSHKIFSCPNRSSRVSLVINPFLLLSHCVRIESLRGHYVPTCDHIVWNKSRPDQHLACQRPTLCYLVVGDGLFGTASQQDGQPGTNMRLFTFSWFRVMSNTGRGESICVLMYLGLNR